MINKKSVSYRVVRTIASVTLGSVAFALTWFVGEIHRAACIELKEKPSMLIGAGSIGVGAIAAIEIASCTVDIVDNITDAINDYAEYRKFANNVEVQTTQE